MNRRTLGLGAIARLMAAAVASTAPAAYTGLSMEAVSIGIDKNNDCFLLLRLYANFDNASNTVVNVFNANISADHPFMHNEPFGLPPAALLANFVPNSADLFDSWVSIGLSPNNNGGSTVLDPNFNACDGCFADGGAITNNAGWFNSNPPNNQGMAGLDKKVELAQFAFVFPLGGLLSISGQISLTTTVGTFQGQSVNAQFQCFPAPGALPLLGLAALSGSSRRRRA